MSYEEGVLALLEQGRLEAEKTEEGRQARYVSEDNARKNQRATEDQLQNEGRNVREAKKAEMDAAIAARGLTPAAQIADQNARIAKLEAMIEKAVEVPSTPANVTPPA